MMNLCVKMRMMMMMMMMLVVVPVVSTTSRVFCSPEFAAAVIRACSRSARSPDTSASFYGNYATIFQCFTNVKIKCTCYTGGSVV